MPVNALIIRALLNFYLYYGDNFKIECPTGSGRMMNLFEVAREIADRLTGSSFGISGAGVLSTGNGKVPGRSHWRDYILFYEYFHGITARASVRATRRAGQDWSPR